MSPDDHLLEELRKRYPDRRIYRTPWGWASYLPRHADEIQAETLQELAEKLDEPPAGPPPPLPGRVP